MKKSTSTKTQVDEITQNVDRAVQTGRYIIACFRVEDDKVHLDRTMVAFPAGDLTNAVQLLANDLLKVK